MSLFYTVLTVMMFWAVSLQAAERTMRFFAQPGGQVTIQGGHKPYDWDVRGRVIEGVFECGAEFPVKRGQVVKPGKVQAVMEGFIPLRSLHSCYGSLIDEFMYSEMNETNAPRILFHFSNLVLTNLSGSKSVPYQFESRAELVVAGVTNRISMPLSVMPMAEKKLLISGQTFLKLSNLGLQASKKASLFVKNGDEIKLTFEWLLGRKPWPSTGRTSWR